ncbi:hypothetical protein [Fulvivirga ligni]|uniref:hypothetical protein n=1 Tax=Fulvivirga ligni TaxID=2904246 RepID=UPI001F3070CB|nr:hypothetical protein [Fulvivirga ligni]UII21610.1 hypothetical protein LVD16_27665 [Fulvivirga ligni]
MIYPTGGYDKIVYEANTVYTSRADPPPTINVYDYIRGAECRSRLKNLGAITITNNQNVELTVRNTNMTGNFPTHQDRAELVIVSSNDQGVASLGTLSGNDIGDYLEKITKRYILKLVNTI